LRAPDREGEGQRKGMTEGEKDDQQESEVRIRSTTAAFIFPRKDCVYNIVIDIVSWQLFICPRIVLIARYYC
jgi:hypothetical protein